MILYPAMQWLICISEEIDHKNIVKHKAHTIVLWLHIKDGLMINISALMIIIRWGTILKWDHVIFPLLPYLSYVMLALTFWYQLSSPVSILVNMVGYESSIIHRSHYSCMVPTPFDSTETAPCQLFIDREMMGQAPHDDILASTGSKIHELCWYLGWQTYKQYPEPMIVYGLYDSIASQAPIASATFGSNFKFNWNAFVSIFSHISLITKKVAK